MAKKKMAIPFAPTRRLMKECGAAVVEIDAVNYLSQLAEQFMKDITIKAIKLVEHRNKKKLTKDDLDFVVKQK